jgi:hypothetical protein
MREFAGDEDFSVEHPARSETKPASIAVSRDFKNFL